LVRRIGYGFLHTARRLLEERALILRRASEVLREPMLAEDGGRVARMAAAIGGDHAVADALPLVVMLRGAAYGYM
jgi:hypothetical protein